MDVVFVLRLGQRGEVANEVSFETTKDTWEYRLEVQRFRD